MAGELWPIFSLHGLSAPPPICTEIVIFLPSFFLKTLLSHWEIQDTWWCFQPLA